MDSFIKLFEGSLSIYFLHMIVQFTMIQGLFVADEPVLSLYAHGKLTGCVIDFGHSKTGA